MPAKKRTYTPVECTQCGRVISRNADLPRHMDTHASNKEELMHACEIGRCTHRTLQQSNLDTHTATHSGKLKYCFDCSFADKDPRKLMEHLVKCHSYKPIPTSYRSRRKSRRSAAAPYPPVRYVTPLVSCPSDRSRCPPRPTTPHSQASSSNSPWTGSSNSLPSSPPYVVSSPSTPSSTSTHLQTPPISPLSTFETAHSGKMKIAFIVHSQTRSQE
ncbi:hypothetical protein CY34DRAFT_808298 [Suillus luteus UH-Slu-Lm8-n1]|uniref:C2H2-type domain-containing protein n=1 Tax=Suillus luteus UH-Slu-Lm8-n1 TaxID=930992 RepID=A0A0D0AN65_9AGAM|nr:hypothetical protein CY34DRAFT_808298 [Suillus luteus UH-Slu-Lm8-n1]